VGGVGFAAMHVAKTGYGAGEYTVLSLMPGGMVGGAAIDVGWLLKAVLAKDKRSFSGDSSGFASTYFWQP
jgi:hypothetical protein